MSRLYDYYSGMEREEDGETETQPIAFSRYQNAYIHPVSRFGILDNKNAS